LCILCSHFVLWMTISSSGSWILANRHCRWIRNATNNREPVLLGWKWVRNGLNRSGNRFWTSGGSLGLKQEYFGEYSLGSARVWLSCLLPRGASDARGIQWQTFKQCVWDTSCSDYAKFCISEFVWMNSTWWNDQKVFLATLKNQVYPKNSSVFWRTELRY